MQIEKLPYVNSQTNKSGLFHKVTKDKKAIIVKVSNVKLIENKFNPDKIDIQIPCVHESLREIDDLDNELMTLYSTAQPSYKKQDSTCYLRCKTTSWTKFFQGDVELDYDDVFKPKRYSLCDVAIRFNSVAFYNGKCYPQWTIAEIELHDQSATQSEYKRLL